jgi:hypothetical protein
VQPCFLFRRYCNCFPTFLKSYVCMHKHDHWTVHEEFCGKIIFFFHTLLPMHNHIFLLKFVEKDQLGTRSPERAFVSLCTPLRYCTEAITSCSYCQDHLLLASVRRCPETKVIEPIAEPAALGLKKTSVIPMFIYSM